MKKLKIPLNSGIFSVEPRRIELPSPSDNSGFLPEVAPRTPQLNFIIFLKKENPRKTSGLGFN